METHEIAINWTELPGNKWLKSLEPAMLTTDGLQMRQVIKPIGRPNLDGSHASKTKKWYVVSYDKSYAIHYLIHQIMEPLNIPTLDYLLDLMLKVWETWHSNSSEKLQQVVRLRQIIEEFKLRESSTSEEF